MFRFAQHDNPGFFTAHNLSAASKPPQPGLAATAEFAVLLGRFIQSLAQRLSSIERVSRPTQVGFQRINGPIKALREFYIYRDDEDARHFQHSSS